MTIDALIETMRKESASVSNLKAVCSSTSKNYFLNYNGSPAMLKVVNPFTEIGNVEKYLREKFESHLPVVLNQVSDGSPAGVIRLEAKVLRNWNKSGVSSPKLLYSDDKEIIVMSKVEGVDYKTLIEEGKYSREHHRSLLETLGQIEELVLSSRDVYNIHNDFHLGNFMYDEKKRNCVAIDPGRQFNEEFRFKEVNGFSNLFFSYSLFSKWFFRKGVNEEIGSKILSDFIGQADASTIRDMKELNKFVSPMYLRFTKLRGMFGNIGNKVLWLDQFNKRNYKKIEKNLNSKIKIPSLAPLISQ